MNIYVDIDNTICYTNELGGPDKYERSVPIEGRIAFVNNLYDSGNHITYWTARGSRSGNDYRDITERQLREWGCKYHELIMGTKPAFDLLIDDRALNPNAIQYHHDGKFSIGNTD